MMAGQGSVLGKGRREIIFRVGVDYCFSLAGAWWAGAGVGVGLQVRCCCSVVRSRIGAPLPVGDCLWWMAGTDTLSLFFPSLPN